MRTFAAKRNQPPKADSSGPERPSARDESRARGAGRAAHPNAWSSPHRGYDFSQVAVLPSTGRIQRFSEESGGQSDAVPASVDEALASPGSPLEPPLRQEMEGRFGHDFSRVRVHSGAAAEQSARELEARAYTVGHDIVFGAGLYAPGTHAGRQLLAHELAHVVQQRHASPGGPLSVSRPGDRAEREAEGAARASFSAVPMPAITPAGLSLNRAPGDDVTDEPARSSGLNAKEWQMIKAAREHFNLPPKPTASTSTIVGILLLENGEKIYIRSGEGGPEGGAERGGIPRGPGEAFTGGGPSQGNIATHVEGKAAAIMHQRNIARATLLVEQPPCKVCDNPHGTPNITAALPPGAKLTVVDPLSTGTYASSQRPGVGAVPPAAKTPPPTPAPADKPPPTKGPPPPAGKEPAEPAGAKTTATTTTTPSKPAAVKRPAKPAATRQPAKPTPTPAPTGGGKAAANAVTAAQRTFTGGAAHVSGQLFQIAAEHAKDKEVVAAINDINKLLDAQAFVQNPTKFTAQYIAGGLIDKAFEKHARQFAAYRAKFLETYPDVHTFNRTPLGFGMSLNDYRDRYELARRRLRTPSARKTFAAVVLLFSVTEQTPQAELDRIARMLNQYLANEPGIGAYYTQYTEALKDYAFALALVRAKMDNLRAQLGELPAGFADDIRRRGDALYRAAAIVDDFIEQVVLLVALPGVEEAVLMLMKLSAGFSDLGERLHRFAEVAGSRLGQYDAEIARLETQADHLSRLAGAFGVIRPRS